MKTEAQANFERDAVLMGHPQAIFDNFRNEFGSYSTPQLASLFEGYKIFTDAEKIRIEQHMNRNSRDIPTRVALTLVRSLRAGFGCVITAPVGYDLGYALATNKQWPEGYDADTGEIVYSLAPKASGAEYVDIVLVPNKGVTDNGNPGMIMGELDESYMIKTANVFEAGGQKYHMRRLTEHHTEFMAAQNQK